MVIGYSQAVRSALRQVADAHGDSVVERFGRVVLLESSAFGRFVATRFRAEFGAACQVERVESFVPARDVAADVREAAEAYADREAKSTSYARFAAGTEYPGPAALKAREE